MTKRERRDDWLCFSLISAKREEAGSGEEGEIVAKRLCAGRGEWQLWREKSKEGGTGLFG